MSSFEPHSGWSAYESGGAFMRGMMGTYQRGMSKDLPRGYRSVLETSRSSYWRLPAR